MTYTPQVRMRDRAGYSLHAAPESIRALLRDARRDQAKASEEVAWLEVLLARRCQQVAAGEWPPGGQAGARAGVPDAAVTETSPDHDRTLPHSQIGVVTMCPPDCPYRVFREKHGLTGEAAR